MGWNYCGKSQETDHQKLTHGYNPFHRLPYFDLPTYTQKTNDSRSVGYQFKMNMKTVNNEASKIIVEEELDGFWATNFETLSKLNSFLELQMQKSNIINP